MKKGLPVFQVLARAFLVMSVGLLIFSAGFGIRGLLDGKTSDLTILLQAKRILEQNALKDLPLPPALEYGMIKGMVQAYNDPYTVFVEPPQHTLEINTLEGKFGGIGVRIERDSAEEVRLYPVPGSPAQAAGILDGDRLIKVEDLSVDTTTDIAKIQAALSGPVGKKVSVTIGHAPDFTPVKLAIERAEIGIPSLTYNLVPEDTRVGILHVSIIAGTTPDEIKAAVKEMQAKGATSFILDLRNNGGGLVDAGVETARLFLKDGIVIEQQYKGKSVQSYPVEKAGELSEVPLVVMVNGGTASAAEIVAGALQSHQRGKLVGANTYGKDVIQLVFDLKDGSSLHVTAAKWWVPGFPVPLKPDIAAADDNNNPNLAVMVAVKTLVNP
jgi:carboxyl-terminal processing protease